MDNMNKTESSHAKAIKKYANSKYRPNVFIDKDLQDTIVERYTELNCKTFNEYITKLILEDIGK